MIELPVDTAATIALALLFLGFGAGRSWQLVRNGQDAASWYQRTMTWLQRVYRSLRDGRNSDNLPKDRYDEE